MKFNDIFVYTGQYGLYQKIISISVCLFITSNVLATISVVFTNGDMDHHCKYVERYNATAVSADSGADYDGICEDSDCWEEGLRNLPADDKSSLLINETQCTMYIVENNETDLVKCKYGWTYDRSQYDSTIVSAFDLVCEDSYKVALSISLINAGSFFGSILCGFVCDYFGRKKTIVVSYCLKFIIGILTGIAPNYWTFAILRFISGCIFTYIPVFVYVTEIVGPSKRAMVATLVTVYWCFGYMLLAVIAYFVRSWNILTLVINLVFVPFLSIFFFIPESPRWLILKDRKEEAKRVLQQIAKVNKKKKIPDETLELLEDNENSEEKMQRKTNPLVLIRYPLMRRKTLNIAYSWFTINLVYYGITYGIESFKVNVYIGIFLSGVSEIFAYLFTWFVLQKFGRRYTLAGTLVLGGIACFINIWIPVSFVGLRTAVAMIGKFFIASAFAIVYVFSAELFPTDVRTIGVGICSFCSCVSGMLAPQVLFFGKLWTHLPLVTFSVMSVSAGLLALLLPETLNVPLPQTIEEAEMMTRNIFARQQTQDGVHHLQPLNV